MKPNKRELARKIYLEVVGKLESEVLKTHVKNSILKHKTEMSKVKLSEAEIDQYIKDRLGR